MAPMFEYEDGESDFGNDDYNHLLTGVPGEERTKEEELALTLRALMDTALKEQAVWAASFLLEDLLGDFTNP